MKRLLTTVLALASVAAFAAVESHWDGGRNVPVHRLALNDEFGDPIVPGAPGALPMSARKTCGQCHDYETIAAGWHSNMSSSREPGRPAQPWFLIDPVSGSQIPMSLRDWPGTHKPGALGMTDWEWVYAFGRHLPGGDIAEPADFYAEGGPRARWEVSGPVEVNCFACHSQSAEYDHSEWVRLILRQNYRWAATGALGLGDIRGMGSRVADYWGLLRGLNRDDAVYAVPPHVLYDKRRFDSKNRVVLEVGNPRSENCLNCHSTSQAGMGSKDIDGDVHLRAGMSCTDCHSAGLDHKIARGYEGDNTGCMDRARATASCTACHMGENGVKAGRYGAPLPRHVGIPISHFKDLSCTACHSGVTRDGELAQVRTSRANRMGVYGRARWATPQPFIIEPVFVRNSAGKIEPRRMAWPAFWGARGADDPSSVTPLLPERVHEACAGLLDVREQAGLLLNTLATDANIPGKPTLAIGGALFQSNVDGVAVPVEGSAAADGWYYKTATNLIAAIPAYDPAADTEKMSDEQLIARQDAEKELANLLQTLDASPLAVTNGYGSVVIGSALFYRGGSGDTMISTNAPGACDVPQAGWYKDGSFTPLVSEYVAKNVKALGGSDYTLTEEMAAAGLKRMQERGVERAVYVAHGQVWELGAGGELVVREEKAAAAVSWAVGHDVRPGRMARGAAPAKCADCHTPDSAFFFTQVASTGPLLTTRALVKAQHAFMELSGSYNKVFGITFLMRPLFKVFLWVVFVLIALVSVAFVAAAVPVALGKGGIPYGKPTETLMVKIDQLSAWGLGAAAVYLGLSGVSGWLFHLMTGYALIFHMVAGGLFAVCLMALIWLRGSRRLANNRRNGLWAVVLMLGSAVIFSAVAPMMTLFDTGWQVIMLWTHRCSSMAFLAVSAWMLLTGGRKE
ncbi:MAG: multiheme c-type cytochrome [Kiritimatiellae bacterium]|nr:multiheme c-type cytochrome [Kiritimatiellia bacterium]